MATVVYMPEVLANVTEATVATWSVAEGDTVVTGDTFAEIETEKAVVDFASEHTGVVAKLLIPEGTSVTVGDPIAVLSGEGDTAADVERALTTLTLPTPAVDQATQPTPAAPTVPAIPATPTAPAAQHPTSGQGNGQAQRFASPLARRMAREHGLDITSLVGSGPSGRIVRRDIERALAAAPASAPAQVAAVSAAPSPAGQTAAPAAPTAVSDALPDHTRAEHTRMRKTIARRLTESKTTVPHYYVNVDCRVDALLALRAEINATRESSISVNDLIVKATAQALVAVPEANVMWTDSELLSFTDVNVSVAIATEGGLVTPVIHNVASLSLSEISHQTRDYAQAARENRIRPEMLAGGTFTVSNLGMFGIPEFSAILNPPQAGILAVGAAIQTPVVTEGQVGIASVMRVTLSADHRAIDGAVAARFLKEFQRFIEQPLSILV